MSDGDSLSQGLDTYRIPSSTLVHRPAGELLPTAAAFALSPPERAARDRGDTVRVSVWDASKITATDAKAQRTGGGTYLVFRLPVLSVEQIALGPPPHPALRVVEDRAGAPDGAVESVRDAHAGIEGLDQEPQGVRLKVIRAKLAEACSLATDE